MCGLCMGPPEAGAPTRWGHEDALSLQVGILLTQDRLFCTNQAVDSGCTSISRPGVSSYPGLLWVFVLLRNGPGRQMHIQYVCRAKWALAAKA